MLAIRRVQRWLTIRSSEAHCTASAICTARRVPEWGMLEMRRPRLDTVDPGPFMGWPTQ